jgi:Ca-activated chloride channel family protein
MLEGIEVSGDLRGLMLDMQLTQRFVNSFNAHAEIVYTFPLPWGAVLLNVEVTLGDKKLTGAVVDKRQAEAKYEEALSAGDAAIMLEKNGDQSYSLNLGNIAPKEQCVICLRYAQTLQFEQRGLRLLIPTVIAPRYECSGKTKNLPAHLALEHDLIVDYPFDINLRIHGAMAHARVASPSHPIGIVNKNDMLTLSLARRGALDRDFVLLLDQLQHDSIAVTGHDKINPELRVVMASFCPNIVQDELPVIAVNLLVDCSGSMAGDSIASARRALQSIVGNLHEGDRYSLSRFGTTVEHRSRAMWRTTPTSKLAAKRWVNNLDATLGGTEMEEALLSTFTLAQTATSDVLMITDGEIANIDSVIESARTSGHRVFIVGIGSSPAESHLRRLAQATGGACDFVAPGEAVEPAILRMFARLRSPRMNAISLAWPEGCAPIWVSDLNASVFDSDTVNVFALLPCQSEGYLRLLGRRTGNEEQEEISSVVFGKDAIEGGDLSRVAASNRINAKVNAVDKKTAQALAVSYQLVTEYTNFLLVHERAEEDKATDMPELHQVKHMVPAGWGGTGEILFSRKDTSSNGFDGLSKPAVWRRETASDQVREYSRSGMNTYDIPAFLRKAVSDEVQESAFDSMLSTYSQQAIELQDRSNDKFWIAHNGILSLTPLGVTARLGLMPQGDWPTTYGQLSDIGVSSELIDWLDLVIGKDLAEQRREAKLVASFLKVMSQIETCQHLLNQAQSKFGVKEMVSRLLEAISFTAKPIVARSFDVRMVQDISHAFKDLDAMRWPEAIFEVDLY